MSLDEWSKAAQPKSLASNLFLISYRLYMQTIEVSIFFNIRPGIRLFGWELCPNFWSWNDFTMSVCVFAHWHHGGGVLTVSKYVCKKGTKKKTMILGAPQSEPRCEIEQNGPTNSPEKARSDPTRRQRYLSSWLPVLSHLRFQTVHQRWPRWGQQLFHWSRKVCHPRDPKRNHQSLGQELSRKKRLTRCNCI